MTKFTDLIKAVKRFIEVMEKNNETQKEISGDLKELLMAQMKFQKSLDDFFRFEQHLEVEREKRKIEEEILEKSHPNDFRY